MRHWPKDEYDQKDLARLNAEPWMVDLLKVNPEYTCWGPYEDYMGRPGRDEPKETNPREKNHGWESRMLFPSWDVVRNLGTPAGDGLATESRRVEGGGRPPGRRLPPVQRRPVRRRPLRRGLTDPSGPPGPNQGDDR